MDNFVFVHGDICDTVHLMDTMKKYGTDAVVHFAAESSVDKSNLLPNLFTYTNIAGSMIVAECCHSMSVKLLLHASTDEVYGETRDDDEKGCDQFMFFILTAD
jgi:dTDP-glucose 4,6-dehydratase